MAENYSSKWSAPVMHLSSDEEVGSQADVGECRDFVETLQQISALVGKCGEPYTFVINREKKEQRTYCLR